jgi:hypothetical protein
LWLGGIIAARVEGYGATIAAATAAAGQLASAHPQVKALPQVARARARWKVDVVVGRGPVERDHTVLQLVALHPASTGWARRSTRPARRCRRCCCPTRCSSRGSWPRSR